MMCRASLGEFGPSPSRKPPGEAKGACGSLFVSATAADMEVSKISAGVRGEAVFHYSCFCYYLFGVFVWQSPGQWWEVSLTRSILTSDLTWELPFTFFFCMCRFSVCLILPPLNKCLFLLAQKEKSTEQELCLIRCSELTINAVKAPSKKEQKYHRNHLRLKRGFFCFLFLFFPTFFSCCYWFLKSDSFKDTSK